METVGHSVIRKDAFQKVTGAAEYTADRKTVDTLYAKLVISPYAHAKILNVGIARAQKVTGVRAILTGQNTTHLLTGEEIRDRPIIAYDRVRYYGEVVAVVIADSLATAKQAAYLVDVSYSPLPVVNSPTEAFQQDAPLIHENLGSYKKIEHVYPIPGTNICNHNKIRKGNMDKGWQASTVIAERSVTLPIADHAAMETRSVSCEILPNGHVIIHSASQAPFAIKRWFDNLFNLPQSKITVYTPLVGGAYGGKSAIQLEFIVYLASKATGGQKVSLTNSREEDFVTSPVHIGLDAQVKLGSDSEGNLQAAEILFLFDGGGYSDKATDMSKAAAVDCTGPYHIENVRCDSLCMYTNHPYATSFRGFGHPELTFAIERTMDLLAEKLSMDPLELRWKNAITWGQLTPTQVMLNKSDIGDTKQCIEEVKGLIDWDEGTRFEVAENIVRAKGASCFWKTSNIETNAGSGVILTFNEDGTVNLSCGVVEIGTGSRSVLAQIAAERLDIPVDQIYVKMDIDTSITPEHWKTVASRGLWMAGRAVLRAAEDAIGQLFWVASQVLRAPPDDLEIGGGYVYIKSEPRKRVTIQEIAYGYVYPNGNGIGGQVIGRGVYTLVGMTYLDPDTGKGDPGPDWTVGAQAVEVEFNARDFTYKLLRAATVVDAGTIINPKLAEGQVMGAMNMGLSYASREGFIFDKYGRVLNNQFRTYKLLRYGENPEYKVGFVHTPSRETAYGLRGIGEHGVIGMPAALASSLSRACGVPLNFLPLLPEKIWRATMGGKG
ncbi:xanthine dehydrogenase molybdenum binding subunit apoprotein [Scopulibacillus darangshiensis]|uniref:Xanthine dehydrogenase molybdenum binding subunit apoprotein n=1 Tax=Scopulibacillus darangshiensis TaxID=442528 RepID=A0A4R2P443_9BACL|nr:xanthine dehydrogenase family protein molybdopterin-binding subunit [Scopulibacillus darangshiensis]TCP29492.1 xanthine dehydrogenase molybdenum binding subunit apoprotein [Scopulibacillus darangshiensis]